MSSKGAKEFEQATKLVPKRRFPEFVGADEWEHRSLGSFAKILDERVGNKLLMPYSITSGIGLVSQQEKFGRTIAGTQLKNYVVVQNHDFAYNKSATKEYPQGFAVMFESDTLGCVPSSIFTCFRIENGAVSPSYLNYLLRGNLHGRWLANYSAVGARANGSLAIDDKDLLALPVPLPKGDQSLKEQEKIADCLSSLDAVIAAEGERLAALRVYKKGLMQQLFPRPERIEYGEKLPAETTPRLRFPEFRDAGEWEWTTVDAIAKIFKGKGISKADIVADGQLPCVRYGELYTTYGEVIDEVTSRTDVAKRDLFMSRANDVIVPSSGETKIDIATAACVLRDDIALGGDLNVIRSAHNGTFLSYFFNGPLKYSIAKVAQGDSVVHLYPSQIGTLSIAIPSADEQKRIADTMFAVDRALVERRHQITALKAHKAGLLQQLFPSPVERGA